MGSCPNAHLGYGFRIDDDDGYRIESFSSEKKEKLQIQYRIKFVTQGDENGPTFVLISTLHYSVDWDDESVIVKMQDVDTSEAEETLKKFCSDYSVEFRMPKWHLFVYYG